MIGIEQMVGYQIYFVQPHGVLSYDMACALSLNVARGGWHTRVQHKGWLTCLSLGGMPVASRWRTFHRPALTAAVAS